MPFFWCGREQTCHPYRAGVASFQPFGMLLPIGFSPPRNLGLDGVLLPQASAKVKF
jgi:hypothetical protein